MTLQHVLSLLLLSQTLRELHGSWQPPSPLPSTLLCPAFLFHVHACVALSSANRILRGGRPHKSGGRLLALSSGHSSICRSVLKHSHLWQESEGCSGQYVCQALTGLPLQPLSTSALLSWGFGIQKVFICSPSSGGQIVHFQLQLLLL